MLLTLIAQDVAVFRCAQQQSLLLLGAAHQAGLWIMHPQLMVCTQCVHCILSSSRPVLSFCAAAASTAEAVAPVDRAVLHSSVDPTLWRMELERVAPRLRIALPADARDWRTHLEEAHGHAGEWRCSDCLVETWESCASWSARQGAES